jgi:hypothetical protein
MTHDHGAQDLAIVRICSRESADVCTYEAVAADQLDAKLADTDAGTTTEDCEIALPIPSVDTIRAALSDAGIGRPGLIGTVAGGVWISGPLAGQLAPHGFDWYG